MLTRRLLVAAAALAATVSFASLASAQALAPKHPTIAFFDQGGFAPTTPEALNALVEGLKEQGLVAGRDYDFITRFGGDQLDKLDGIAAELVALKPDLILTRGNAVSPALRKVTTTIPIVATAGETVAKDIFGDLARPTANVTGIISVPLNQIEMQFAAAREAFPTADKFGWIDWVNQPSDRADRQRRLDQAVKTYNMTQVRVQIDNANDLPMAFQQLKAQGAEVVILTASTLWTTEQVRIRDLATAAQLPVVWSAAPYVQNGALMSFGVSSYNYLRDMAPYAAKLLKGAKPSDLPVNSNPRFELAINQKTAAALGVKFPDALVKKADYVID